MVSFPPLSYMLKFSGSSHSIGGLIQGCSRFARTKRYAAPSVQTLECVEKTQSFYRTRTPERGQSDTVPSALRATRRDPASGPGAKLRLHRGDAVSGGNKHSDERTPRHIPGVQVAFRVLMIRWILQFALRIAFRCVLHRCGSQDIRR